MKGAVVQESQERQDCALHSIRLFAGAKKGVLKQLSKYVMIAVRKQNTKP